MRSALLRRLGAWWWLLLVLFAVVCALLAKMATAWHSESELAAGAAIVIQSTAWRVGAEVELTLEVDAPLAGERISVTVLSPGSGEPQIDDRGAEFRPRHPVGAGMDAPA